MKRDQAQKDRDRQSDQQDAQDNPDYFFNEEIGKNGLEFSYERILRGQPGEQLCLGQPIGYRRWVEGLIELRLQPLQPV